MADPRDFQSALQVTITPANAVGPQGASAPDLMIEYSIDGTGGWTSEQPSAEFMYFRVSTDGGYTWSEPIVYGTEQAAYLQALKAQQWAENPENVEVEPGKYSALHHATKASMSELNALSAAVDAEQSAVDAFGAAAPAWDSATTYSYNDVVSFDNGHTYRCIGDNVTTPPNTDGVDDEINWTRITVAPDGFFEYDTNYDFQPVIAPVATTGPWMLDELGDIQPRLDPDLAVSELDELISESANIKHVDSVAELRSSTFSAKAEYLYLDGYYGKGTLGGGLFYRDSASVEPDNGGTIFVDAEGVRWKRSNVGKRYMASWFGATTDTTKITDNTPAIQNALNAMPGVGELVFEEGIYDCYGTIAMPDWDNPPDHIHTYSSYVKAISLTGVATQSGYNFGNWGSALRYVGPNKDVETPFFDFRGSYAEPLLSGIGRNYMGCIKNLTFLGQGENSNIIGLWFSHAIDSHFSTFACRFFKNGIRIDGHYYYSSFYRVQIKYCKYGFNALSISNGASFYACVFSDSSIAGMRLSGSGSYDAGATIESCYFEANNTAIEANVAELLTIKNCYFEGNSGYVLDVSNESFPTSWHNSIVIMHNCLLDVRSNSNAVIKQTSRIGAPITYSLENNYIYNSSNNNLDYFIYVDSGDLKIKAENNLFIDPQVAFPVSSQVPLEQSLFNNDFTA